MTDAPRPVACALLSVFDKTGISELAAFLHGRGVRLIASDGTARRIAQSGVPVEEVSRITGFAEMLGGRVKTLHPRIHGGLLARRDMPADMAALAEHKIAPIDLLVVDFYPFREAVESGADRNACIEQIDIGAPAMTRAAAKNHASVTVITGPGGYRDLIEEIEAHGGVRASFRRRMALAAFARTASYDAAIAEWMAQAEGEAAPVYVLSGRRAASLRYGENPHQAAALYARAGSGARAGTLIGAEQVQGKQLGYNNLADADAGLQLLAEFGAPAAAVIVKHANPCGAALGENGLAAYRAALACDRQSAFGGIVALNRALDAELSEAITGIFTEVVIAPQADSRAREIFARKKNLRLLLTGTAPPDAATPGEAPPDAVSRMAGEGLVKQIGGGFLVQDRDGARIGAQDLACPTRRKPEPAEMEDLLFVWRVCKHVKSNAVVLGAGGASTGIGAGQMSRVDAAGLAVRKAGARARGSVAASDAFFPFPDGVEALAGAGVRAIIQPGGARRDAEVIAAADQAGIAMVMTGRRHLRH